MRIKSLVISLLITAPAFAASSDTHCSLCGQSLPRPKTIAQSPVTEEHLWRLAVNTRRTTLNGPEALEASIKLLKSDMILEGLFFLKIAVEQEDPKALQFCEIVDQYNATTYPDDQRKTIKLAPNATYLPLSLSQDYVAFLHGYFQGYEGGIMKFHTPSLRNALDELFYTQPRFNEILRGILKGKQAGFKQAIEGSRVLEKLQTILIGDLSCVSEL